MFLVLFSTPGIAADEINSVSQPGDLIVGSLPLANGETVWVQAREAAMSPDEQDRFASIERQYMGFGASDLDSIEPWALWLTGSPELGTPLLIEFPLGRRHFQGTPES
jgi:hypothetical protein